jgi:DNA-binding CsgD family transcriptional regulator
LEREAELSKIRAAVGAAVVGDGGALVIEGKAGLGKTRLLGEASGLAAEAGAGVFSARAGELERDFPFAVLRQLLGPQLRAASAADRESLFDGAGPARQALGLQGPEAETSPDTFSVLHALYWVVAALSERGPLLLTIDDAHVADSASLDWIAFMLPRLDELPVSLLLARRTDEAEGPELSRIVGDPSVETIRPLPLSIEGTATLIGEAVRQEPDASFVSVCQEVTGGNPFLVTELGRELADQGIDPRAELSESARGLAPQRVSQMVLARISRLPAGALALARAVAVLGDGCESPFADELAGLDLEEGRRVADSLRTAAIFDPGEALRFVHPLIRNAVYTDIATGERGAAHATAAALVQAAGASPERVATHLLAGEPRGDQVAATTLLEAGRRALADGAPRSAVSYLTRALQEPPPADLRLEILRQLLTAGIRTADQGTLALVEPEARAAIERDPASTRDLVIGLAMGMALSARFEEAARLLPVAVQTAAEEGDMESAFKLDSALRTFGMVLPSIPEVDLDRYMGEVELDSPAGRLAAAIEARSATMAMSRSGAIEAARRALGNDCSIFEEEPEMISAAASILILLVADEMDTAAKAADRALEIARERNSTPEIGRAWFIRGLIAWGYGDLVGAESDLRQAREIAILAAIPALWLSMAGPLALVLIDRDELDAAEAILAECGAASGPLAPTGPMSMILMVRARLRCERGEFEHCLEDVTALSDNGNSMGVGPTFDLGACLDAAKTLRALGRIDEARELAEPLLETARHWGAPASLSRLLRTAAVAAEGPEEIELLEEAVAVSADSPRRLQAAEALVDLGAALRRQNHRAAARDPLREGLKAARQCGAVLLAKHAHEELQATGETVRRYTPIGVESLTPSERRVADLAASGMTNRQIAQSLFVTLKTVEAHLSAAYDKLDISSRRELAAALSGPHPAGDDYLKYRRGT